MCYISVIVPIYNSENSLNRCVDSILSQSYADFELILVDDGSTDSSGFICDSYVQIDERVRVFHKENGGVSSARNVGINNARGKWITFCDSDDYVANNWLEAFFNISGGVNLAVQSFDFADCCSSGFKGGVADFIETFHDKNIVGYTGNKLFLRQILEKYSIQFDESFTFHEDEVFAYQYLQYIDKIVFTPQCAYHYNRPAFDVKYRGEIFEPHYAVFCIIEQIHRHKPINRAYEFYLRILYRSLFDSFLKKDKECKDKLRRYWYIIKRNSSSLSSFPLSQRMVLCLPLKIAYIVLKWGAMVRRKW